MSRLGRSAVVVFFLACAGQAAAVTPEIKDEAKFFSADAIKKANEIIRDISLKYGKDLLIETFSAVPGDETDREKVRNMSAQEKTEYFQKWAVKRAEAAVVRGVYILICKDPTFFKIEVGKRSKAMFDDKAVGQLGKIILDNFKDKKFDEGLLAAVKFVQDGFAAGKVTTVAVPEIKDEAKFFSADAIKKANEIIRDIAVKYGKDLRIETFTAVPGDDTDREKVRAMSAQEKTEFFHNWAVKRAEAAKVQGVYILICKDPTFFKIEVGKQSKAIFDDKAVARLGKVLMDSFKDKKFDDGLLAGVKFVQAGFAAGKVVIAQAPEIKDDGKFFSAETIKSANEIIREISTKYKQDLVFETYAGVPADDVEKVKTMNREEKYEYFHKWAVKRMEALKMNGVYLLVTKDPTFFKIEVSEKARSIFDRKAVANLQKTILEEFRDRRFDEGLLAGVKLVRDTFAAAKKE
jgi:hypothetical protein